MKPADQKRRDQRGEALVVWCVGLAVLLLPLGGVSVDLWHGISVERSLQDAASSAAAAGASGIDATEYRQSGVVDLQPDLVQNLVAANLQHQTDLPAGYRVSLLTVRGGTVTVQLKEELPLTLLRILVPHRTLDLSATATARATPSGAP
jgi:Flp pilus assembly protein TadG